MLGFKREGESTSDGVRLERMAGERRNSGGVFFLVPVKARLGCGYCEDKMGRMRHFFIEKLLFEKKKIDKQIGSFSRKIIL